VLPLLHLLFPRVNFLRANFRTLSHQAAVRSLRILFSHLNPVCYLCCTIQDQVERAKKASLLAARGADMKEESWQVALMAGASTMYR
jgi:hypothetical protein